MPEDRDLSLVECMAKAQAEFGSLAHDQHAVIATDKARYEYDYTSEGVLMARAREILSPMGVAIFVSAIDKEIVTGGVWVTVEIDFHKRTDGENESIAIICRGLGQDARDKAYNKGLTSAVRTGLTKQFLQGGDIDPEKTVNEPARPSGPAKLADARIKEVTQAAIDNGLTMKDGSLDSELLLRLASYTAGERVKRMDEIPGRIVEKLVGTMIPGFAVSPPADRMDKLVAYEEEKGWV